MRAKCFDGSKLAGNPRLFVNVCALLVLGALAILTAGPASAQAPQPSAPSGQNNGNQTAAGQSGNSAVDQSGQSDVFDVSIGDQLGSYVPENPQGTGEAEQPTQGQPGSGQPAATQSLVELGAPTGPAAAARSGQPAPAVIVEIPVAHSEDERRQAINNECANLVKMAAALKAQVDRTSKDELSVAVIRQANQIEQLAHRVRDEMRPAVASKN